MSTTQALLDKHKRTLSANGFYITTSKSLAHMVNPTSIHSFIGYGENYILHDNMQDFLICGQWGIQSYAVSEVIEAIPASSLHIYMDKAFRSGTAHLYILSAPQTINEAAYKYEMIPAVYQGNKLYRIKALKDFGDVKKGDIGGYIESGKNLDQKGHCWVYGNAQVTQNANVSGNAKILDNAKVSDDSIVNGNAIVAKNAIIWGKSEISGRAEILGHSQLVGCKVDGKAKVNVLGLLYECVISGNANIHGKPSLHSTTITGNAEVYGECKIIGSTISGNAKVYDRCEIEKSEITDNAKAYQMCAIRKGVKLSGNAEVSGTSILVSDIEVTGKALINGTPWIDGSNGKIVIKGSTVITSGEIDQPCVLNESTLIVAGGHVIKDLNESSKKYELIATKSRRGQYQIKALKNFGKVRAGDLGGFVDSEYNLSQDGDCWIFGNASVTGNAKVYENALINDDAEIFGYAQVYGSAKVNNDCQVYGNAQVRGRCNVYGKVSIYGNAIVEGNAYLKGKCQVYENAVIKTGVVQDMAKVFGKLVIDWETIIGGRVEIGDKDHDAFVDFLSGEPIDKPSSIGDALEYRRQIKDANKLQRRLKGPQFSKEGRAKLSSEFSYNELVRTYGKRGADEILKKSGVY